MTLSPVKQPPRPWLALALVCLPVFIGALDLTIVTAFLPEIIVGLELPIQSVIDDAAWVVNGYLLAYTVSMMFMGRVSDLIGRRSVYIACLVIFIVGSIIVAEVDPLARTGVANVFYRLIFRIEGVRPDPGNVALITIIFGRVVQALGAGALVPVSLALVGDLFPPERRARPLGLIGAIDTLGWVLGHLYGGILVSHFSHNAEGYRAFFQQIGLNWAAPDWRALFWINVPVTLVALALTWLVLRNVPQQRAPGRFDFVGTLLIAGALIALVLGLGANIEIASSAQGFEEIGGLPPYAGPVLAAALLLFVTFIAVERRVRDPLFDLNLFRKRNLSSGLIVNLFVGFCIMIGLISVPLLVNIRLQDASNLADAALQVGILLSALTVPMALAAFPGGWLAERIGYNKAAAFGLFLATIGFALIGSTWTYEIPEATVAIHMAIIGIGLGLTFSPISAAVINAAPKGHLGVASALVIILRLVGMTVSVSLLTTLASRRLAYLAFEALGTNMADAVAAIDIYARLTIRVLAEIGWMGALICAVALIPALLLQGRDTRTAEAGERRQRPAGD